MMKRIGMYAVAVIAMVAFSFGCEKAKQTEEAQMEAGAMPEAAISAPTVTIGNKSWTVEVAQTIPQLQKGLSERDSLSAGNGMLFVFAQDETGPFWMKDTKIPLDMAFMDGNNKIVHLALNNTPLSEDFIQSPVAYRTVLEVNAGELNNAQVGNDVVISLGPQQQQ
jgi:uncharacterized membrane protein (UPF0127 family)